MTTLTATSSTIPMQIALIEHDNNGDDLCVWVYPALSAPLQNIAVKRSSAEAIENTFIYTKYKSDWLYISRSTSCKESQLGLVAYSVVVASKTFNPEKFQDLLHAFTQSYKLGNHQPGKILEVYLSVFTTGSYSTEGNQACNINFSLSSHPDQNAMSLSFIKFKEIVDIFSSEIVILWNAVILKKRIVVVGESIAQVTSIIRALPYLAYHRKDWSILRPIVSSDPDHLEDLASSGVFIAGTTDTALSSRTDLFDVLVSLSDRRVTVTQQATSFMKMCSIHRELANAVTEIASNSAVQGDNDILTAIANRTNAVISQIKNLVGNSGKLTFSDISENVSNEAAQQWLYRLASAENLI